VPLADIARLLVELTTQPADVVRRPSIPGDINVEVKIAMEHNPIDAGLEQIGQPSPFACPECHGVLLQMKHSPSMRFRCHTGHAYSTASLVAAISDAIEESMWEAIRTMLIEREPLPSGAR